MASILNRDLVGTKELDRQAAIRVKGGYLAQHVKPGAKLIDLPDIKTQVQVAVVNNIAVAPLGGVGAFDLQGGIGQGQLA